MKKEQLQQQFQYILDRISSDDILLTNDFDKMQYFFKCFDTEYNHEYNRKRWPNLQDRIREYISGLPSCFSIDFSYCDIIEVGKSWGYCTTPKKEDTFCRDWFNTIAFRLAQLSKCYGYNLR